MWISGVWHQRNGWNDTSFIELHLAAMVVSVLLTMPVTLFSLVRFMYVSPYQVQVSGAQALGTEALGQPIRAVEL